MVPTPPGPDTRAPLPHTRAELRALVRDLADRGRVPYVVALWYFRAWLVGFYEALPDPLVPVAKDDSLTLLAIIDAELFKRDGWRPAAPADVNQRARGDR